MIPTRAVRKLPLWTGLLLAMAFVATTLFLRLSLSFYLGDQPLMVLFVIPLILSAYFGGMEAGLAATVMAALTTVYLLVPPVYSFKIATVGYRLCAWLEDRYPEKAARWWSYPQVVLTKRKRQQSREVTRGCQGAA